MAMFLVDLASATALSLSEKKRPDPAEQIGAQRKNEGS